MYILSEYGCKYCLKVKFKYYFRARNSYIINEEIQLTTYPIMYTTQTPSDIKFKQFAELIVLIQSSIFMSNKFRTIG